ncbi:MAG: hypothetical protein AOA65_0684 [Candidatus Bathyarchaeota archaeon BA1]|nr:MAG: hypothetical protein AOA65_0684 [Candidatus Bathyarchaeota archaeon BA1]
MAQGSKLKVKRMGLLLSSIYYTVVGGAHAFILLLSDFRMPHIGLLAFLSLTTAYGLIKMRKWSVLLVIILFPLGTTFGATTLYTSIMQQSSFYPSLGMLLFHLTLVTYLIMSAVASIYIIAKRKSFE